MTIPTDSIATITYRYGDSSVPPKYHRSYEVRATANQIRLVVDSYGDVLTDTIYSIKTKDFSILVEGLELYNIASSKKETEDKKGCTGGTSRSIAYADSTGKVIFDEDHYRCGGAITGTLCGEVDEFAALLKQYMPDFKEKLKN